MCEHRCDCWSRIQKSWFSITLTSRLAVKIHLQTEKVSLEVKYTPLRWVQACSLHFAPSAEAGSGFSSFLLSFSSLKSASADICTQVIRLCWHCLISPPPFVLSALISHHKVAGRNLEIPHLRILLLPLYSLFVASVAASFIVFFIPSSTSSSSWAEAPLMEASVSFKLITFVIWCRVFVVPDV